MKHTLKKFQYRLFISITSIIRFFKRLIISHKDMCAAITPYAGSSDGFGKKNIVKLIVDTLPNRSIKILDVGPGRGIYNALLKAEGYTLIDAVEKYKPYIDQFDLVHQYNNVFHADIRSFKFDYYDIVIFGDVLEHLSVKSAQRVIKYAQQHSKLIVVSVPYCNYQIGQQLDGSGDHKQPDLTRKVFLERYVDFNLLVENKCIGVFYSLRQ